MSSDITNVETNAANSSRTTNEYVLNGFRLSNSQLRTTQFALAFIGSVGMITPAIMSKGFKEEVKENITIITVGGVLTAVCIVSLFVTCFFEKKRVLETIPLLPSEFAKGAQLQPLYHLNSENQNLLDELCERDGEGRQIQSSLSRISAILDQFKQSYHLSILNSIPNCCANDPHQSIRRDFVFYTPLHYWAKKGNLPIVKILIKNGAKDYFTEGEDCYKLTSALYQAALYGHPQVVKYLLDNGSHIDIAFANQNILHCFIPKLTFELVQKIQKANKNEDQEGHLECFRLILSQLNLKNSGNLQFQLSIPIDKGYNALNWIDRELFNAHGEVEKSLLTQLRDLLIKYGAVRKHVFKINELEEKGCNIGTGITLYRATTFKA